jgi:hypothetical protein
MQYIQESEEIIISETGEKYQKISPISPALQETYQIIQQIGEINLIGNVIPHSWYKHIQLNGKPDCTAILILAEILYWWRPRIIRDEHSGETIRIEKRFKADLLQKSYNDFCVSFGFSKKQVKEATDRLEELKLIKKIFKDITNKGSHISSVLFIKINPKKIKKISIPFEKTGNSLETLDTDTSPGTPYPPGYPPPTLQGTPYTYNTYKEKSFSKEKLTTNFSESELPSEDSDPKEFVGEQIEKPSRNAEVDSSPRILSRSEFEKTKSTIQTIPATEISKTDLKKISQENSEENKNGKQINLPASISGSNGISKRSAPQKKENKKSLLKFPRYVKMKSELSSLEKKEPLQVKQAKEEAEKAILEVWNEIPGVQKHKPVTQTFEVAVTALSHFSIFSTQKPPNFHLKRFSFLLGSQCHRPLEKSKMQGKRWSILEIMNVSGYQTRDKSYLEEMIEHPDNEHFRLKGKPPKTINQYEQTDKKRKAFLNAFNYYCRTEAQKKIIIFKDLDEKEKCWLDKFIWITSQVVTDKSIVQGMVFEEEKKVAELVLRSLYNFYAEEKSIDEAIPIELYHLCTRFTWSKLFPNKVYNKFEIKIKINKNFLDKHLPEK